MLAVDDEEPALNELTYLLSNAEGVASVTPAGSAAEALGALQAGDFDAVFLDIHIPGIDGLALAKVLRRFATPPAVVFVTAYDIHAVAAFDMAAVDYLLKPLRPERLAESIARVRRHLVAAGQEPAREAEQPAEPRTRPLRLAGHPLGRHRLHCPRLRDHRAARGCRGPARRPRGCAG